MIFFLKIFFFLGEKLIALSCKTIRCFFISIISFSLVAYQVDASGVGSLVSASRTSPVSQCYIRKKELNKAIKTLKQQSPGFKVSKDAFVGGILSQDDKGHFSLTKPLPARGLRNVVRAGLERYSNSKNFDPCSVPLITSMLDGGVYGWLYRDYETTYQNGRFIPTHRLYIGEGKSIEQRTGTEYNFLVREAYDNEFWQGTHTLYQQRGLNFVRIPFVMGRDYGPENDLRLDRRNTARREELEKKLIKHINEVNRLRRLNPNERIPYNFEQFNCYLPIDPYDNIVLLNKQLNDEFTYGSASTERRMNGLTREEFCPGFDFERWDATRARIPPEPEGYQLIGGFPSENVPLSPDGEQSSDQPSLRSRFFRTVISGLTNTASALTAAAAWLALQNRRN